MKICTVLLVFPAAALFSVVLSGALPANVSTSASPTTVAASSVASQSTDIVTVATPTTSPIDVITPTKDNLFALNEAGISRFIYKASSTSINFANTLLSSSDNNAARNGFSKNEYVAVLVFMAVGFPLALSISLWYVSMCLSRIREREQGR